MLHTVPRQLPLSHEATAITVSADGKRLAASAIGNGRTVVYDLRVGRVLFRLGVSATALAFSPDARRLVTAGSQQRRALGSRPSIEITAEPAPPAPYEMGLEPGRSVRVWDLVTGRCLTPEAWNGEAPIALSPDGTLLAAWGGRESGAVLVMRVEDGSLVRALALPSERSLRSLAWSPDGAWLIALTGASAATFWSTNDFQRGLPEGFSESDVAVAFAPRGSRVAAAGVDCRVRVSAKQGAEAPLAVLSVRRGEKLLRGIEALEFSPDAALVLARGRTGATQLFSVDLARPLWTASPGPMSFLPDGKTIAAWWCGAVWLRDAVTGDMIVSTSDEATSSDGGSEPGSPSSRTVTLRSRELEGRTASVTEAPISTEAPSGPQSMATTAAATDLLGRLSTGWAESGYRKSALVISRDPDGLGVRLPLRGGFAYVQVRPLGVLLRVAVTVTADEPDLDPPPSSSLVRLSRWIRDRLGAEARRQAAEDREWANSLQPDSRSGEVRIERAPSSLSITFERSTLPSLEDLEALVHAAEQKLVS